MKQFNKNIFGFLLLLLFLEYYGSITLFTHTHIVDGVSIVHSHPYNPFPAEKPDNHQHSKNGFINIHLLSHFSSTDPFITFSILVFNEILRKSIIQMNDENFSSLISVSSNGLRAPPLNTHN